MENLLGFDPAQLQQMMAQFGATEEDRKNANKQALFALGFGLLQGRKGNELATIGQAGANALGYRNQMLADVPKQKLESVGQAAKLMQLSQQMKQQQAQAAMQGKLTDVFSGQPQLGNMGPGGPTPANAAAIAPASMIDQYRRAAALYAQSGNTEGAKRMMDMANSLEAEYSTTPQTMKDASGALKSVLIGKRGETKSLDYTPAEKLHFADTGGMTGVGMNPYTGKAESAGLPKTMDPAQKDASARGWAQYTLSKQAEARAADTSKRGVWKSYPELGVQVNEQDGTTRPIMQDGAPMGSAQEVKRKTGARNVLGIIEEAKPLIQGSTGSYAGAGADIVAQGFGLSTSGARNIAKLKALEGALMLNQPRMEGPQSNFDVQLYRQMAAQIGDPTIPVKTRLAALDTLQQLNEKYVGDEGGDVAKKSNVRSLADKILAGQ